MGTPFSAHRTGPQNVVLLRNPALSVLTGPDVDGIPGAIRRPRQGLHQVI